MRGTLAFFQRERGNCDNQSIALIDRMTRARNFHRRFIQSWKVLPSFFSRKIIIKRKSSGGKRCPIKSTTFGQIWWSDLFGEKGRTCAISLFSTKCESIRKFMFWMDPTFTQKIDIIVQIVDVILSAFILFNWAL